MKTNQSFLGKFFVYFFVLKNVNKPWIFSNLAARVLRCSVGLGFGSIALAASRVLVEPLKSGRGASGTRRVSRSSALVALLEPKRTQ